MELPRLNTRVVHSESKTAWNVIGTRLGDKYKIARVPYNISGNYILDEREKKEAYEHAVFISTCFNVADENQQLNDERKATIKKLMEEINTADDYLSVEIPILDMMNVGIPPDRITTFSGESEILKTEGYIKNTIKKRTKNGNK